MPNTNRERLSPNAVVAETRASIDYLQERLQTSSVINPRNARDRRAVTFAVVHQFDLPREDKFLGTEVLARLWENGLMEGTPVFDFIGKHAHTVWREVLGKP